jgi:hypothetical protein
MHLGGHKKFLKKLGPGPERFEVGQKKNVEIIFLDNLRLSFSKIIESPDYSISYQLRSLKIESVNLTYINTVLSPTLTVEIRERSHVTLTVEECDLNHF